MRAVQSNRDVRVLICDDNPIQRASMVECLSEQIGLQVICAVSDGLEALRRVTELQPDVVICDLVMTRLDGFGLLERMAQMPYPPQTIVLTALKRDDFIMRALELGAAYYMVKPVESDILTQRILAAARRRERQWEDDRQEMGTPFCRHLGGTYQRAAFAAADSCAFERLSFHPSGNSAGAGGACAAGMRDLCALSRRGGPVWHLGQLRGTRDSPCHYRCMEPGRSGVIFRHYVLSIGRRR